MFPWAKHSPDQLFQKDPTKSIEKGKGLNHNKRSLVLLKRYYRERDFPVTRALSDQLLQKELKKKKVFQD